MNRSNRFSSSLFCLSRSAAVVLGTAAVLASQAVQAQAPVLDPRDTQGYHEGSMQNQGGRPPAQVRNPSAGWAGDTIAVPRSSERELRQYYAERDSQRYGGWWDRGDDRRDRRDRRERRWRD